MHRRPGAGRDLGRAKLATYAKRVRDRIARGLGTDTDREWIARWEASRIRAVAGTATIPLRILFASVCGRLGVTRAQLAGKIGTQQVMLARRVFALVARSAGYTLEELGTAINRIPTALVDLLRTAKAFPEALRIAGEVEVIARTGTPRRYLAEPPIPKRRAQPRETYTITGVVGDELWRRLDRWAENEEIVMPRTSSRTVPPPFRVE